MPKAIHYEGDETPRPSKAKDTTSSTSTTTTEESKRLATTTTLSGCLYEPVWKWQTVIELLGWRLAFEINLHRPWQKLLPRRNQ